MKIIVLTNNNYHHCLPGFAYLFNKFWSDQQAVTVACYDALLPDLPDNFTAHRIGYQVDHTWSSGLLKFLNELDDEQFVLMLEDYYLSEPVNLKTVRNLYQLIQRDTSIVKIDLTDDRLKANHAAIGNGLIESVPDAYFQTSLQAAIWRRSFLKECLHPSENPWQFEKKGTRRLIEHRAQGFDGRILGAISPPVKYINAIGGEGTQSSIFAVKRFPKQMWIELVDKGLIDG